MDRLAVLSALEEKFKKAVEKEERQKKGLSEAKKRRKKAKSKLSVARRENDKNKKILIGAYILNQLEKGYKVEIADYEDLIKQMDKFLIKDYDRKRFGLAILNKEELSKNEEESIKYSDIEF